MLLYLTAGLRILGILTLGVLTLGLRLLDQNPLRLKIRWFMYLCSLLISTMCMILFLYNTKLDTNIIGIEFEVQKMYACVEQTLWMVFLSWNLLRYWTTIHRQCRADRTARKGNKRFSDRSSSC